ncbi:hypothetical protein [Halovenus marina]
MARCPECGTENPATVQHIDTPTESYQLLVCETCDVILGGSV